MIASILSDPFSALFDWLCHWIESGKFLKCMCLQNSQCSVGRPSSIFLSRLSKNDPMASKFAGDQLVAVARNAKCCSFKIPLSYFLVEFVTGLAFGYVFFISSSLSNWESESQLVFLSLS